MPSMTTDYRTFTGDPKPYLERIARAGFSEIHWCHEWATDHLYSPEEIKTVAAMVRDCGLQTNSLHASNGPHPGFFWWSSDDPAEEKRGIRLMENRLDLAAGLECDTVIIHVSYYDPYEKPSAGYPDNINPRLDAAIVYARKKGVRLAAENLVKFNEGEIFGNQRELTDLFGRYTADELGYCYDSGHGNMVPDGLDHLERWKNRLTATHLQDNDGTADQHLNPFEGTTDWERLTGIIRSSSYNKELNLESVMRSYPDDMREEVFLANAYNAAAKLTGMVKDRNNEDTD